MVKDRKISFILSGGVLLGHFRKKCQCTADPKNQNRLEISERVCGYCMTL